MGPLVRCCVWDRCRAFSSCTLDRSRDAAGVSPVMDLHPKPQRTHRSLGPQRRCQQETNREARARRKERGSEGGALGRTRQTGTCMG